MTQKSKHIPVNILPQGSSKGIMMMRHAFNGESNAEVERAHRDGGYTFIVQEKGKTFLEIDFTSCCIEAPAIMLIHPQQVHRVIRFEEAFLSTWIITEENLHPEYRDLLNGLAPVNMLKVDTETLSFITETVVLCMNIAAKKGEPLHQSILKQSCNTLVALIISQYIGLPSPATYPARFDSVTKSFIVTLEKYFKTLKSPSAYANRLHFSTAYLNECVKAVTGKSVSAHIQQRIILEAKRLLYHSDKSVKEIASELGFEDYSYFIRLFTKGAGMTPGVFREKNRE